MFAVPKWDGASEGGKHNFDKLKKKKNKAFNNETSLKKKTIQAGKVVKAKNKLKAHNDSNFKPLDNKSKPIKRNKKNKHKDNSNKSYKDNSDNPLTKKQINNNKAQERISFKMQKKGLNPEINKHKFGTNNFKQTNKTPRTSFNGKEFNTEDESNKKRLKKNKKKKPKHKNNNTKENKTDALNISLKNNNSISTENSKPNIKTKKLKKKKTKHTNNEETINIEILNNPQQSEKNKKNQKLVSEEHSAEISEANALNSPKPKKKVDKPKKQKFAHNDNNTENVLDKVSLKHKLESNLNEKQAKKSKFNELLNTNTEDNKNSNTNDEPARKKSFLTSHKDRIRKMFEMDRTADATSDSIASKSLSLRQRMLERLKSAQFRYLNEQLYTSDGNEAKQMFQEDPTAFQTYHEGYQQQVKKWPVKPLDIIVEKILKMPTTTQIADMGCGEGTLAQRVPHPVRSFDLVSVSPGVETCDMAHTPLGPQSVGAAVYCLALMGTTLTQYLLEANRVLKTGGTLMIAEVESRFDNVDAFIKDVERLGFKLTSLDKSHQVFYFMELKKVNDPPNKKNKLPKITLKPCLYKRR